MDEIAEAELSGACRDGVVVDGSGAGGKRVVRAALLRKCCYELKDQIDRRGLRLENAVVAGCLDLAGLAVPFPLRFAGCEFDSPLVAEGAELFELSLTGCASLPGLLGNGLRIRRDLDLSRCRIAGAHRTSASTSRGAAIWLCESEIGGRLLCVDTVIDGQGQRAIQGPAPYGRCDPPAAPVHFAGGNQVHRSPYRRLGRYDRGIHRVIGWPGCRS